MRHIALGSDLSQPPHFLQEAPKTQLHRLSFRGAVATHTHTQRKKNQFSIPIPRNSKNETRLNVMEDFGLIHVPTYWFVFPRRYMKLSARQLNLCGEVHGTVTVILQVRRQMTEAGQRGERWTEWLRLTGGLDAAGGGKMPGKSVLCSHQCFLHLFHNIHSTPGIFVTHEVYGFGLGIPHLRGYHTEQQESWTNM